MHDPVSHHHDSPAVDANADGTHEHIFLGAQHDQNARRTCAVIAITAITAITATMMVVEIGCGSYYGSMALAIARNL